MLVTTFSVSRWVVAVVGIVPSAERLRKLFKNFLAGLRVQSLVFRVGFQFVFEFAFVGNFSGFVPLLLGVVISDIPEFGC